MVEVELRRGRRRKQHEAIEVAERNSTKHRSKSVEGVLVERELLGGGEQKEAAGSYRSRSVGGVLVERELRG